MLIQLPDQIALKYQEAADRARIPLATLLARQLARFADTPVSERVLVLTGPDVAALDKLLGTGSCNSAPALVAAVTAWASITIGNVEVYFTQAQLDEIAHRAEKQGKTPTEIITDIVDQMAWRFFDDAVVAR